ncbi:hypothetical protein ABPG73_007999 [Tetrahymena malaccensis]
MKSLLVGQRMEQNYGTQTIMKKLLIGSKCNTLKVSQKCDLGCLKCSYLANNQNMMCENCEDKYLLKNGVCVFQGCQPNLHNQVEQNLNSKSIENCQSICDPLFYADELINICKLQVQCSSIYSTQLNILNNGIPLDFFIYQQSYYVAIQQGYLSIYNRSTLSLIKNLSYQQDDLTVQNISGLVIVIKNDFSLNIWDILIERRYHIEKNSLISITQDKQYQPQQTFVSYDFGQSLKKILINYSQQSAESLTNFEIVSMSSAQIQIIRQSVIQKQVLEVNSIENFNAPFPTPSSQVNSLILNYFPPLLISCHQNGDIIFYDTSKGESIYFIQRMRFINQKCLQLLRLHDNKISALVGQNVLLIDASQQIILSQFTNLSNIIQITSNYDKLAINYNNCIKIVSSEFQSLFQECDTYFSSNNLNIALNSDLTVVIQKNYEISIYQVIQNQQIAQKISSINTQYHIQYFNIMQKINSDSEIVQNKYQIEEIVFFDDQNNFKVLDFSLSVIYLLIYFLFLSFLQIIAPKGQYRDSSLILFNRQENSGFFQIKKKSNFVLQRQININDEGNLNFFVDFSQEYQKDQILEQEYPTKVQNYNFLANSSKLYQLSNQDS